MIISGIPVFGLPDGITGRFVSCMSALRAIVAAGLLAAPYASAQIYADVETSLGTFTFVVDYQNSPLASANFIALAEGTRPWIDSATGAVHTGEPYYDNLTFHRVIAGFMNQCGSQNGLGNDGPGYAFQDEFTISDFSSPYLVAMANSGPQTNGSQIFVTVGTPTYLNGVHTVFGNVPADDGPGGIVDGSRGVVDAINGVATSGEGGNPKYKPLVDVTILSITIRRVGTDAENFDEHAQDLPTITAPVFTVQNPGTDCILPIAQGVGSTLRVGLSGDLSTWNLIERYIDHGAGSSPTSYTAGPEQTRLDRHFYQASVVTWPLTAVFPNSMANRIITVIADDVDPVNPITFTFDATGLAGTYDFPFYSVSGPFTVYQNVYNADGLGGTITLDTTLNYRFWQFRRMGMDSSTPSLISGRHSLTLYNSVGGLIGNTQGSFTLTR